MKITPTSLKINQLLGSDSEQYVIPTYQRRYSWSEKQLWDLIDDINLMEEDGNHLLGSIVCLTGVYRAGINKLELVDGQQRLTTITILLECIREHLSLNPDNASAVSEVDRLLYSSSRDGKKERKVLLDSIDSVEFEWHIQKKKNEKFQNENLSIAFRTAREWIFEQSHEKVMDFLYRLKNQGIIIRLDVSDAKDAFKLFETINNRGLRLSPTDIIKNFILGNAARFGDNELQDARTAWAKLVLNLDGTSSDVFFRYYLMVSLQSRITASNVVSGFKKLFMAQVAEASNFPERHLYTEIENEESDNVDDASTDQELDVSNSNKMTFKSFLANLENSAKIYGQLIHAKTPITLWNRRLRNLKMIQSAQTYGFLMHLLLNKCDKKNFSEILKLTESFVLRRHICRERANETESLFARLCRTDATNPVEDVKIAYRELHPSDEKFYDDFCSTNFTSNIIDRARYCLEQIEMSKHGSHSEVQVLGAEDVHVEHIIPQKIRTKRARDEFGDWVTYLGENSEGRHPKYVSLIGNLTIVSGALNIGASNNPFLNKKKAYKESGIKLTLDLAKYPNFKYRNIDKRSKELAATAVSLWPIP